MTLKNQIQDDIKQNMREKNQPKLNALRLLSAAIKQKEVDTRTELGDAQILEVIDKAIKQRKDSIDQYQKAGRQELAASEQFEIDCFMVYKPEAMSEEDVLKIVEAAVSATGASTVKDMGKVMTMVKPQVAGKADMGVISSLIKQKLA